MKSLWRIVVFTRILWKLYAAVAFFAVLVALMSQVQPLLLKVIVDEVTKLVNHNQANMTIVVVCVGAIFVADVGQTFFSNINGYFGDQLQVRLRKILSERYFAHLLTLPQRYYDVELSGKILNQLNRGIDQIMTFVQAFSNNFLQFIFSTILSLGIVLFYSWQVGLMLALLYPIILSLTMRAGNTWRGYQTRINSELDVATGRFAEVVSQIKVVKSFKRESSELSLFQKHYQRAVNLTRPQSRFWHKQDVIRRLALNVIFLGVYAYICLQAAHGTYSLGTMVLLLQYAAAIRIPIFSISFIVDQGQRAVANTRDYFAALDEAAESRDESLYASLVLKRGEVKFQDVYFGYDDSSSVLKGLTMTLTPGTKTALVGKSGEGKTTITNIILGLYEPQEGAVLIDGQNITEVTQQSLRAATTIVFQEPALFSGTVHENIAYGNPGASKADIIQAAKAANAHVFIEKFPKGYATEIGERGLKLSGGQKQRIAIARAILKDAPILILDEATSSLDSESEHAVQEALERLMHGRTTLIIAHRLSTIASVDTVVTLKDGRVHECGPPGQLAKSDGIYAQLLQLQVKQTMANKKKLRNYEMEG